MVFFKEKYSEILIKLGFLVSVLLVWELLTRFVFSSSLIPPVSAILVALWKNILTGEILRHTGYSLYLIFTGIALGMLAAFALTAFYMVNRTFAHILDLVISIMHPLPGIALLPIVMLLVGLGSKAIILIIVHSVVWPIIVNSIAGFRTIPKIQIELGRSIGMSELRLFFSVMIPNAFPHIFSGIKIAWSRSWRALVGAEMVFGATGLIGGLGWFIYKKRYFLEIPDVFAGLLIIILIGIIIEELLMKQVEKRTIIRWGISD